MKYVFHTTPESLPDATRLAQLFNEQAIGAGPIAHAGYIWTVRSNPGGTVFVSQGIKSADGVYSRDNPSPDAF